MAKEMIILVDEHGKQLGTADKLSAHTADTPLHLAFSCYVFDASGRLLVTQRAHVKKVWPTVWTNSVCGHPLPGESMEDAIRRRLRYELGMTATDIRCALPTYTYKTPPYRGIIEHEFCPVFFALATSKPDPNPREVADYIWEPWDEFTKAAMADSNNAYSWWCKDQLPLLSSSPLLPEYTG
jgi:isopentenyl-diphosphate delta-isomerase